ncbi:MAG TPA: helix-turn-helix domain-containing protein [Acidobacteriaceae bacterium]|jgi:excisionase family DNA binding protein|nr:helix-turn-helix domain-containing protein [Acidobacteriaceae bacterium]
MLDILTALETWESMMTPDEVAELFNVSKRTVQRMIASREIPAVLFGGQRRIDPAALHRHLRKKCPALACGREKEQLA